MTFNTSVSSRLPFTRETWETNVHEPNRVSVICGDKSTDRQMWRVYSREDFLFGPPMPVPGFTTEELKEMGIVGVYRRQI